MAFKNPLKPLRDNVHSWWDATAPSIVAALGLLAIVLGKDASQVPGLVETTGALADSILAVPTIAIDRGFELYEWILMGVTGVIGFGRSAVVSWKKFFFEKPTRKTKK